MLKISDFSKLAQISIRMLHYYDQLDLLKPIQIDRFTGYRYYSVSQLPRLNRIIALKDLGFSLEQVSKLLDDELTPEQMRGMFKLKKAEVEQQVELEQVRLRRLEARLRQIEQEDSMPEYEVVLKRVAAQQIVAIRENIPSISEIGQQCQVRFNELFGWIGQAGLTHAGPPFVIYYNPEYTEKNLDAEMAMPVEASSKVKPPQGAAIIMHELAGSEAMASVVHNGSYETINLAYAALGHWVENNSYQISGPFREIYLSMGDAQDGTLPVTELQVPVGKA